MLLFQLAALLLLLMVTAMGPGLLIVRRLQWRPLETLGASVALSHFMVYVAGMAIYTLRLPTAVCYIGSLLAAAATAACWGDLRLLWSRRHVRHAAYAAGGLFLWVMLMQSIVRHYSGGLWFGDWYEHYERARFFLDRPDVNVRFLLGIYILPARPPLMNVVAAFYMAQTGTGFEIFQVVFTFLNVLAVLAAALLLPLLLPRARRPILLLAALCALNPMFVQNSLWTWTKLYAAFFVILGVGLYLRGWREPEPSRLVAAFLSLAAATLTHYSAGPVLLFMALHYMTAVFRSRPRRWRELAAIVAVGTFALSTWFAWSIHTYGVHDTIAQNTTVAGYAQGGQTLSDAAYNVFATIVPYPVRGLPVLPMENRSNAWAELRDRFFHLYQTNLLFAFGSVGWLPVLILMLGALYSNTSSRRPERWFWIAFLAFCIPVGIAAVGERHGYGYAHVIGQPLVLAALGLLAVGFLRLPSTVRVLYLFGLALDYALGMHLPVHLQTVSPMAQSAAVLRSLGTRAHLNLMLKERTGSIFLADHLVSWQPLLETAMALVALALIVFAFRRARRRTGPRSLQTPALA